MKNMTHLGQLVVIRFDMREWTKNWILAVALSRHGYSKCRQTLSLSLLCCWSRVNLETRYFFTNTWPAKHHYSTQTNISISGERMSWTTMVDESIDLKRTALTSAGAALLPYVQPPMHASALKAEFWKWHMYVKAPARLMLYACEVGAHCTSLVSAAFRYAKTLQYLSHCCYADILLGEHSWNDNI